MGVRPFSDLVKLRLFKLKSIVPRNKSGKAVSYNDVIIFLLDFYHKNK